AVHRDEPVRAGFSAARLRVPPAVPPPGRLPPDSPLLSRASEPPRGSPRARLASGVVAEAELRELRAIRRAPPLGARDPLLGLEPPPRRARRARGLLGGTPSRGQPRRRRRDPPPRRAPREALSRGRRPARRDGGPRLRRVRARPVPARPLARPLCVPCDLRPDPRRRRGLDRADARGTAREKIIAGRRTTPCADASRTPSSC